MTRRVHASQGCLIWLCCRCSKFKLDLDFPSFMQWWQEVGLHQYAEVVFQWAWNLSTSKAFTLCGVIFLHLCFHIVCTILLLPPFVCICSILQYWWQEECCNLLAFIPYHGSILIVLLQLFWSDRQIAELWLSNIIATNLGTYQVLFQSSQVTCGEHSSKCGPKWKLYHSGSSESLPGKVEPTKHAYSS